MLVPRRDALHTYSTATRHTELGEIPLRNNWQSAQGGVEFACFSCMLCGASLLPHQMSQLPHQIPHQVMILPHLSLERRGFSLEMRGWVVGIQRIDGGVVRSRVGAWYHHIWGGLYRHLLG